MIGLFSFFFEDSIETTDNGKLPVKTPKQKLYNIFLRINSVSLRLQNLMPTLSVNNINSVFSLFQALRKIQN